MSKDKGNGGNNDKPHDPKLTPEEAEKLAKNVIFRPDPKDNGDSRR